MRHGLALLALFAALLLGLAGADWVAGHDDNPGTVWLVLGDSPRVALTAVLAGGDARLVNTWFDGRVVQLHVDSLAQTAFAAGPVWLRFSASSMTFALPACGG